MKDYIKIGVEQGYISFDKEMSRITYTYQNKQRNYNNPEEKVQAETFLRLIIDYKYPVKTASAGAVTSMYVLPDCSSTRSTTFQPYGICIT